MSNSVSSPRLQLLIKFHNSKKLFWVRKSPVKTEILLESILQGVVIWHLLHRDILYDILYVIWNKKENENMGLECGHYMKSPTAMRATVTQGRWAEKGGGRRMVKIIGSILCLLARFQSCNP